MHGLDTLARLNHQAVEISRLRKDNNGSRFAKAVSAAHAKSTDSNGFTDKQKTKK